MALDNLKMRIESLRSFDAKEESRIIVDTHKEGIVERQRTQLLSGKDSKGDWIRPFYSEDSFFKTKAAALAYAKWKAGFFPNYGRPLDVPNLYINGYFHRSLFVVVSSTSFSIKSANSFGKEVIADHKTAIGLNPKSMKNFSEEVFMPFFRGVFQRKTGLSIK